MKRQLSLTNMGLDPSSFSAGERKGRGLLTNAKAVPGNVGPKWTKVTQDRS